MEGGGWLVAPGPVLCWPRRRGSIGTSGKEQRCKAAHERSQLVLLKDYNKACVNLCNHHGGTKCQRVLDAARMAIKSPVHGWERRNAHSALAQLKDARSVFWIQMLLSLSASLKAGQQSARPCL